MLKMYIGTYTQVLGHVPDGKGKGIHICEINAATGEMVNTEKYFETEPNPSFLCTNRDGSRIYFVSETQSFLEEANTGSISALSVNPSSPVPVRPTTVQAVLGMDPCYIELDKSERFCLAANYTSGTIAVFPVNELGLGPHVSFHQQGEGFAFPGPTAKLSSAHAHQIRLHPQSQSIAYVPDLGMNSILQYTFDVNSGVLVKVKESRLPPASGPRHIDFSPDCSHAFVTLELTNEVAVFTMGPDGFLSENPVHIQSALPSDFDKSTVSDVSHVLVHPEGRFVYVANRGHNSIACFVVEGDGFGIALRPNGHVKSGGLTPRHFTFAPRREPDSPLIMVVSNQDSHNLSTFRVSDSDGTLESTGFQLYVPSPVCVAIVNN